MKGQPLSVPSFMKLITWYMHLFLMNYRHTPHCPPQRLSGVRVLMELILPRWSQLHMQSWCIGDISFFSHLQVMIYMGACKAVPCIWWRIWLESITLKAAMVISALFLQKLHPSSKAQKHVVCLQWWLDSSQMGDINNVIVEGCIIQHHLKQNHRHSLSARIWWTDATGKGQCCPSNLHKWEPLTQSWIHIQINWPLPSVMSC